MEDMSDDEIIAAHQRNPRFIETQSQSISEKAYETSRLLMPSQDIQPPTTTESPPSIPKSKSIEIRVDPGFPVAEPPVSIAFMPMPNLATKPQRLHLIQHEQIANGGAETRDQSHMSPLPEAEIVHEEAPKPLSAKEALENPIHVCFLLSF